MSDPAPATPASATAAAPAPIERGWAKYLFALAALVFLPVIPQVRAMLPIEQTMLLFVPAVAACALVGWWAGGRPFLAVAWVAIAVLVIATPPEPPSAFYNLARGWGLLLAGAFGLVCLVASQGSLLRRASVALCIALALAAVMSAVGRISVTEASRTIRDEFARRNGETLQALNTVIQEHPKEWQDVVAKAPPLANLPTETQKDLESLSGAARAVFPALLALESLAILALAWATYHRLGRARLGLPLRPLREFRFNDQLVWGLIVGLTIMLVPTLGSVRGLGKNLLVFFGVLYAMRGFGVLTWFIAPGSLGITLAIGFVMLLAPVLKVFAVLAFMLIGVGALALGLGDTWADWRNRVRST
ncbi:MAG TPA: DUF2232 domain-containing protein [Gemmatimonadaceae bacterium]|nr:DUF2232 domain-containing protein [Gemmatimonadaceae bacterium]